MSDFNWSLFDRIHPSTKSVTAALTAPTVGRTRPALKWTAAVTAVTAVAAAIALLISFGPLGRSTPPTAEGTVPEGERIVAKLGDYPVTDREMTLYGLWLAQNSKKTLTASRDFFTALLEDGYEVSLKQAAFNCVQHRIAIAEIADDMPDFDPKTTEDENFKTMYGAKYDSEPLTREICDDAGISRQEYVDSHSRWSMGNHAMGWHKNFFTTRMISEMKDAGANGGTFRDWEEYARYMAEKLENLEFRPVDQAFLDALEQRMAQIAPRAAFRGLVQDLYYYNYSETMAGWRVAFDEPQRLFAEIEARYPGATQAAAYEKFCLAVRVWNGEAGVSRADLDLNAAMPAICLVAEGVEDQYGLWYRKTDGALFGLATVSKNSNDPTFTVEDGKLMAYGYEVQFHSAQSLTLLGEGEMAGDYYPAPPDPEALEDLPRTAAIRSFIDALTQHDEKALLRYVGNEEIAAGLAGLKLDGFHLKGGNPAMLTLRVSGGAFGPIPTGESEWYIDARTDGKDQVLLCPIDENWDGNWFDRRDGTVPAYTFCDAVISELGLFDTVTDFSALSPAWYGERGEQLANVYNRFPPAGAVTGETVSVKDLTAFVRTAFGVKVTGFTDAREDGSGEPYLFLADPEGFWSEAGLLYEKSEGENLVLLIRYYADATRLVEAVTLRCTLRELEDGGYRMLSVEKTHGTDYPPLFPAVN